MTGKLRWEGKKKPGVVAVSESIRSGPCHENLSNASQKKGGKRRDRPQKNEGVQKKWHEGSIRIGAKVRPSIRKGISFAKGRMGKEKREVRKEVFIR